MLWVSPLNRPGHPWGLDLSPGARGECRMPPAKCELVPPAGRIKGPERAGLGPEADREPVSK